jgi:hypothetical protein
MGLFLHLLGPPGAIRKKKKSRIHQHFLASLWVIARIAEKDGFREEAGRGRKCRERWRGGWLFGARTTVEDFLRDPSVCALAASMLIVDR